MTDPAPRPIEDAPSNGEDLTARALASIEQARRTAGKAIDATRRKGEAVIDDTREKTYRAAAETNRLFQEHPVAAVAAAAAVGAVLGIFLPRIAIASRATSLAGKAVKAAAASEIAAAVWSGLKDSGNSATRSAAGKAATAVGERIIRRRPKANAPAELPAPSDED